MTPNADYGARAVVRFLPETDGHLVVMKACWSADNGYETAVFATRDEAVDFAWKRWRVPADRIRYVPPIDGTATA